MATDPIIRVKDVSKVYQIWSEPSARLKELCYDALGSLLPEHGQLQTRLRHHAKRTRREFVAVDQVSFEVKRGESVGIVGRNGAGKSTLLQMIAGTLQCSSGQLDVNGRVAALLELGSGFNSDFTGRENVYLNASILGLSKPQIEAKFESIVEYAGIREFIDQPVRTYSTGMAVRLAFAVCVHVEADIVIIDEALAVGDARFQFKCHATLDQMRRQGKTIIFVSHDTNSVKRMCDTAILLERGQALAQGNPNDIVNLYTKLITSPHGIAAIHADLEALRLKPSTPASSAAPSADTPVVKENGTNPLLAEERAHQQVSDTEYAYGGEKGRISSIVMSNLAGEPRLSFVSGETAAVHLLCEPTTDIPDPIYALTIKDVRGQEIFGTNTYFRGDTPPFATAGAKQEVTFRIRLNLMPGVYFVSLGWVRLENGEVEVIQRRYDVIRFEIMPRDRSFGIAYCESQIDVRPV